MSGSLRFAFLSNDPLAGPVRRGGGRNIVPSARRAFAALRTAWRRQRARTRIATLDAHLLADIGVSFAEAEHEANKPFWRT